MAYGLSAAARGDVFPWVFNPPVTYWDGASEILKYLGGGSIDGAEGQDDRLSLFRRRVRPRGAAVLPSRWPRSAGFDLKLYPVAPADMQNQGSKWLDIRRDKPDFLIMYGWGAMNADRHQGGGQGQLPDGQVHLDLVAGRRDAASAGDGAKGFKELNWHGAGADYPAFADIKKFVIDAGKSQAAAGEFGDTLYDHGVYNSMLIAEAIAAAQKVTGKKVVTGEDVRRGLENINLDEARLKAIGLAGFAPPLKLSCADHNSHGATFVQQWDGAKWVKVSDAHRLRRSTRCSR